MSHSVLLPFKQNNDQSGFDKCVSCMGCCFAVNMYIIAAISAAFSFTAGIFGLTYLSYIAGALSAIIPILKMATIAIREVNDYNKQLRPFETGEFINHLDAVLVEPNIKKESPIIESTIIDSPIMVAGDTTSVSGDTLIKK